MNVSVIFWLVWYAYWIVSARHRVRDTGTAPVKREPLGGRLLYLVFILAGFVLVFLHRPLPYVQERLWPSAGAWLVAGLLLQASGLAFAIWARYTLGKNWAGRVTIGAEQQLVIRGPYRLVRHPIYSGLLLGVLGTAVVVGLVHAFVGFLLVLAGVLLKLRREEAALRQHFGDAYDEYARRGGWFPFGGVKAEWAAQELGLGAASGCVGENGRFRQIGKQGGTGQVPLSWQLFYFKSHCRAFLATRIRRGNRSPIMSLSSLSGRS
jgi:protein-S-isoprenylcysteine O-methyltransferase Ste14